MENQTRPKRRAYDNKYESNPFGKSYSYRHFRETKCRKIKPDQCHYRTKLCDCIRCTWHNYRPCFKINGAASFRSGVVIIDTPGLDDEGELGALRIQKAYQILNKTDIAVLVIDASFGVTKEDSEILKRIHEKEIPCVIVVNKSDICPNCNLEDLPLPDSDSAILVSSKTGEHIHELKELLAQQASQDTIQKSIVADLLNPLDFVVLVVPIDSAAPKGRLILPQQQTIRDILEAKASAIVVQETELAETLTSLGKKPKMVITDSQVFKKVSAVTPDDILLTSFSILFARYKGNLKTLVDGASALDSLKNGDCILISEGCTHHRQCDDIGTVKTSELDSQLYEKRNRI